MINTIIIGSGISGLFTLKHLKELGIHDILVIDKNHYPFGVWNLKNHPGVKEFTYCVSSKLYMTISDFPIPKEYPEFPYHSDILEYYKLYAKKFDLLKHVKCNIEVLNTKKIGDCWNIYTKNCDKSINRNQNKLAYKCKNLVIACGTVNNCLNIPQDKMYNNFTGLKFHSDEYDKYKNELINKKILLIGVSDTACDIAEKQKNENKITMSSRNGVWLQNRNSGAYSPTDMFYSRIIDFSIKKIFGKQIIDVFFGNNFLTVPAWWGINGHGIEEWETNSGYLNSYYVKSRDIINSISKGQIKPVNGVKDISNNEITFNNDKNDMFDVIIFCTGYKPFGGLKFIDKKYYNSIYKHIFSSEDNSVYFVGYIRPYLTSIPMIAELQSRWIAQEIYNNNTSLPCKKEMLNEINIDNKKQQNEFPTSCQRLKTIVDPYDYCNMVADKINAKPNIFKYLLTDIKMFIIILFYSWNQHYFRLNDKCSDKALIAYKNIIELSYNSTSKLLSNIFLWYPLRFIIFILIIYKIRNFFK
jgi:dimethylaniline monooxygenase (N-oxide forming)